MNSLNRLTIIKVVLAIFIAMALSYRFKEDIQGLRRILLDPISDMSYQPLLTLSSGGKISQEVLLKYIRYYHLVDEIIPNRDDVQSMLGFCYYYAGNLKKAIKFYRKAISLNPNYFYNYYNLGLIYYQQDDQKNAQMFFVKALQCDPKETIGSMVASKIYIDLFRKVDDPSSMVIDSLKKTYENLAKLMALLSKQIKPQFIINPVIF